MREQLAIDMPTRCSWLRKNAKEKAKPIDKAIEFQLEFRAWIITFCALPLLFVSLSLSLFVAVHLRLDVPEQMLLHTGVLTVCFDNAYCVLCRCGNSSVHTNNTYTHTHTAKGLVQFWQLCCEFLFCFGFNCHYTHAYTHRHRRALTHAHFSMRIANICIVKFSCCTKCIFTQDFSQLQLQFWLLLFQFLCLLVLRPYSFRWPTRCEWVLVSK